MNRPPVGVPAAGQNPHAVRSVLVFEAAPVSSEFVSRPPTPRRYAHRGPCSPLAPSASTTVENRGTLRCRPQAPTRRSRIPKQAWGPCSARVVGLHDGRESRNVTLSASSADSPECSHPQGAPKLVGPLLAAHALPLLLARVVGLHDGRESRNVTLSASSADSPESHPQASLGPLLLGSRRRPPRRSRIAERYVVGLKRRLAGVASPSKLGAPAPWLASSASTTVENRGTLRCRPQAPTRRSRIPKQAWGPCSLARVANPAAGT